MTFEDQDSPVVPPPVQARGTNSSRGPLPPRRRSSLRLEPRSGIITPKSSVAMSAPDYARCFVRPDVAEGRVRAAERGEAGPVRALRRGQAPLRRDALRRRRSSRRPDDAVRFRPAVQRLGARRRGPADPRLHRPQAGGDRDRVGLRLPGARRQAGRSSERARPGRRRRRRRVRSRGPEPRSASGRTVPRFRSRATSFTPCA